MSAATRSLPISIRALDVTIAVTALVLLAPLFLTVAAIIKLGSPGPAIFRQPRVGKGGRLFTLYKFRTMHRDAPARGPGLTIGADPRVTRCGYWLRRWKLDELPQFWNVLRGDMTIVGPRPELPAYVRSYTAEQREVLRLTPGITDPASLTYRDESEYLSSFADPQRAYLETVLPHKIHLSLEYAAERTLATDLRVIVATALGMWRPASSADGERSPSAGRSRR